ncbi:MAG TPA: leucine-rich repeat domain-containing protein [Verrucomicrobiota bacterium]|nr:leucine-rich repeat domain-containing protein [Verrucomicrobiota bacterium]HPK99326.1 leucine-rich repeat domain-containing protein [Verrucomicrobiota bacterium]HPV12049.1 leucine-rich repeat domain-containing protein [Verrucomicrobiota bacterium]HPW82245.1 leucine-rich repeat domain-containing protein [Verrucomicrobiota bacterium]HQA42457.1 leucine-rich repeat domain-containing protein [Verrucomicrobiota bacterium]
MHFTSSTTTRLLLLLCTLSAAVRAQDFDYRIDAGAVTITRYRGSGGAVNIPGTINGLPVTSIGGHAFFGCTGLTSITIPNSVTSIGPQAFYGLTGLTSVAIPNSVTSIGQYAFCNCFALANVAIPNSVTTIGACAFANCALTSIALPNSVISIGNEAFSGCPGLLAITVDALNLAFASQDGVMFNKSQATLIQCPGGKTGSYTIPDSVTSIGRNAFKGCTGLISITIPDSVNSIGGGAFERCTGLISIAIPNSVTSIKPYAFSYCTSLTSVTIPDSVTSILDGAFFGCTSLTAITIPDSVTSIGRVTGFEEPPAVDAFLGCTRLTGVYFEGDAPADYNLAFGETPATIYFLPGTTGWGSDYSRRPTAPWVLPNPVILGFGDSFGVRTNRFGFIISWATNDIPVAVEACADLTQPTWLPVGSVTLKNGSAYFSDADWANHPARFYRVRSE